METREERWWGTMLTKYGTVEAVRAHMKERANLSSRNSKGTGGFAMMSKIDPDKLREISKLGVEARHAKKETHQSAKRSQSA